MSLHAPIVVSDAPRSLAAHTIRPHAVYHCLASYVMTRSHRLALRTSRSSVLWNPDLHFSSFTGVPSAFSLFLLCPLELCRFASFGSGSLCWYGLGTRWRSRTQFGLGLLADWLANGLVYLISARVQVSRGPHPAWSRRQVSLRWFHRCRATRTMLAGRFWEWFTYCLLTRWAFWDLRLTHFRASAKGISGKEAEIG